MRKHKTHPTTNQIQEGIACSRRVAIVLHKLGSETQIVARLRALVMLDQRAEPSQVGTDDRLLAYRHLSFCRRRRRRGRRGRRASC